MKHIKLFEAWSAKFNRTLQGASAIAKSTNKGFGKAAKEVRDYAEKQISKEEFSLELENGGQLIITHDTNFLLNPISEFERLNPGKMINAQRENAKFFFIPVKVKSYPDLGDISVIESPVILFRDPSAISSSDSNGPSMVFGRLEDIRNGFPSRFSDKSGLENFIAMAIQSILSSPEKVRSSGLASEMTPDRLGMESFPEGMSQEKFIIINFFKNIILNKDIREFTM
jgi:hypothetical protein